MNELGCDSVDKLKAKIFQILGLNCPYPKVIMQNEAGEYVDLYIPRKCSASNRIIGAGDHASIQINLAVVDEKTGRMTGENKTYAICGKIRGMGESDDSLIRLAKKETAFFHPISKENSPDQECLSLSIR